MIETIIGIDASRSRSGGAKAHLIGILRESNPENYGIFKIHIWSYKKHLDELPDSDWIIKHNPSQLEKSLLIQLWWQYFKLPKEIISQKCDVLLNLDAGTICPYRNCVTMSRDMLSYEKGEIKRFPIGIRKLRLYILKYAQAFSLKKSLGVIFLTKYAFDTISNFTGKLSNYKIIPHGVSLNFKQNTTMGNWDLKDKSEIQLLYVSNVDYYKHHWNVLRAVYLLRLNGYKVKITFVGGGIGKPQRKLINLKKELDPKDEFSNQLEFVSHNEIPFFLKKCDIFIFASSCENMPNTLLEAMSSGLPIASSEMPMPEVLKDGGEYFNPENEHSIKIAIEKLLIDKNYRISKAKRAKYLSDQYSWKRCGNETWEYLASIVKTKKYI